MSARSILAACALLVGQSSPPVPPICCRCESRRYLFVPSMIEVSKDHAGKHSADRFLDREQARFLLWRDEGGDDRRRRPPAVRPPR